jgi:hypothetical protein
VGPTAPSARPAPSLRDLAKERHPAESVYSRVSAVVTTLEALTTVLGGAGCGLLASMPSVWRRGLQRSGSATTERMDHLGFKYLNRDMWLTGFDAPSLHTLYVDKPMRDHGLLQAIARVNRVFKDEFRITRSTSRSMTVRQPLRAANVERIGRWTSRDLRHRAGTESPTQTPTQRPPRLRPERESNQSPRPDEAAGFGDFALSASTLRSTATWPGGSSCRGASGR